MMIENKEGKINPEGVASFFLEPNQKLNNPEQTDPPPTKPQ